MDLRTKLQASERNRDSLRRCEFYSPQPPKRRRPVTLMWKITTFFCTFFDDPKKESETFGRNRQIQSFSTSHGWLIACQDWENVSDSGRGLTSRARPARNASALRWQTISGHRLCPSEHLPHRICSKRA